MIRAAALALLLSSPAGAEIQRSAAVVREFRAQTICPSTGTIDLRCKDEVDHIVALCMGGADEAFNLQYLSKDAHARKTKFDVRVCAILRKVRASSHTQTE